MKTRTIIIAVIMTAALHFGTAGEPIKKFATMKAKIEYAKKNWHMALKSGNQGLVESVLRSVAQFKMHNPLVEVTEFQEAFEKISFTHSSGIVRYEAYIAANICSDPIWYAQEKRVINAAHEEFFRAASERMQEKLLGVETF